MSYKITTLQNCSNWDKELPTIAIHINTPEWKQAITNWQQGKNPTNSIEWKQGVYAITTEYYS